MPRLDPGQQATLATWWTTIAGVAGGGYTATQTNQIIGQVAEDNNIDLGFNDYRNIAVLYGYARRMFNAAGEVQRAAGSAVIGPEHIGVPPWARDEVTMATAPIWHVTYTFTYLDQAGNLVSDFRTSVFEMTLPGTIGDLAAAISQDAQALADKYGFTLVDAALHQILAV